MIQGIALLALAQDPCLLVDLVNIVVRGHWLCSPLCLAVLGVAGEEMDYVLLLKWSGDTTQKHYRQNHWDWGRRKPGNWKAGEIKALWNYLINLRRLNTNYLRNLPSSSRLDTTHILDRTGKFSFKIEILNWPVSSKIQDDKIAQFPWMDSDGIIDSWYLYNLSLLSSTVKYLMSLSVVSQWW